MEIGLGHKNWRITKLEGALYYGHLYCLYFYVRVQQLPSSNHLVLLSLSIQDHIWTFIQSLFLLYILTFCSFSIHACNFATLMFLYFCTFIRSPPTSIPILNTIASLSVFSFISYFAKFTSWWIFPCIMFSIFRLYIPLILLWCEKIG